MKKTAPLHSQPTGHPAVALLSELLDVPSPPGREAAMARLIRSKIAEIGFASELDAAGNVLVRFTKDKPGAPVVFAAHMDEIALMVNRIEPDGRLRVTPSGGLMPHKTGERIFDILGDGDVVIPGVLSCGSGHIRTLDRTLDWSDYWVFTGLSECQLRAQGIHEGASMVPAREGRGPLVFGDPSDPFVAAWTFDDRMGVVALLRLLKVMRDEKFAPPWPMIIAFTVHEEGGCHGAKVLAHREQPSAFIAIDGCPIMADAQLKLDGRPAIWIKDRRTCYDQRLIATLLRTADMAGVGLQRAVYTKTASDASAVYDSGAAPAVAFLGHVRENSHGFEVARLSVFDRVHAILVQLLKTWAGPAATADQP